MKSLFLGILGIGCFLSVDAQKVDAYYQGGGYGGYYQQPGYGYPPPPPGYAPSQCNNNRECLNGHVCIEGFCRPKHHRHHRCPHNKPYRYRMTDADRKECHRCPQDKPYYWKKKTSRHSGKVLVEKCHKRPESTGEKLEQDFLGAFLR